MRIAVLVALLASCEGRCEMRTAVRDEVTDGQCYIDEPRNEALCIQGSAVIHCAVVGSVSRRALCRPIGRLVTTPEVN